jgi:hypothetical protein
LEEATLARNGAEVTEIGKKMRAARHAFLATVRQELDLAVDKELLPALP